MGRSKDRGKSSKNSEAAELEKDQDQGVDAHDQRKEREEGKEAEGTEEGKRLQEERARAPRREGRSCPREAYTDRASHSRASRKA